MTIFTGAGLVCFRGERTVFQGLGFSRDEGGALTLRGANGSGKSSLLRLMAGLGRPLSGAVQWRDEKIADDPEAHNRRLHYVGHADPVKPVMTVAENLIFWASLRTGGGVEAVRPAVETALGRLGIGHLASVPGRFLSAGQKRRVNLARVLAAPAELWLLDEPATALDQAAAKNLDDAITEHRAGGGMVGLASHAEAALEGARALALGGFPGAPP